MKKTESVDKIDILAFAAYADKPGKQFIVTTRVADIVVLKNIKLDLVAGKPGDLTIAVVPNKAIDAIFRTPRKDNYHLEFVVVQDKTLFKYAVPDPELIGNMPYVTCVLNKINLRPYNLIDSINKVKGSGLRKSIDIFASNLFTNKKLFSSTN